MTTGEAVHSLHTSRPAELGGDNQRLSGANTHSVITIKSIIQQDIKYKNNKDNKNRSKNKNIELER